MKNFKLILAIGIIAISVNVSAQSQNKANASKMIDLTNSVITLSNEYNKKWTMYERALANFQKTYEQYSKNYDSRFSVSVNGDAYPLSIGYHTQYKNALDATPSSMPDKAKIDAAVKVANNNTEALEKWAKTMREYFKNATFATDEFAAYETLTDSLHYYYENAIASWRMAVRVASEAGDNAEILIIKGTPIEKFLAPMKHDLRLTLNLLDDFYEEVEKEEYNFTAIKEDAQKVIASTQVNISTEGKDVSILSHLVYYTDFFEKVQKCVEDLLLLVAELEKDEPEKIDLYVNNLQVSQPTVVRSYNNFAEYGLK